MGDAYVPHITSPTCCGCIPIRPGVVVLGIVEIIFAGLSATGRAYYLINYNATVTLLQTGKLFADPVVTNADFDWYTAYGQLGLNGVQFFFIVLMFMGVGSIQPGLLVPHNVVQFLGSLALIAQAVLVCLTFGLAPYSLGYGIVFVLMGLFTFYIIISVHRCFNYMRMLKLLEHAPNGHVMRDPNSEMTNL